MSLHHTRPTGKSKSPAPCAVGALYIVATPIGHLGDMTLRALQTLESVDAIACEDTRVSGKLLQHYGIKTRTLAYHDHNGEKQRPYILGLLRDGHSVALISDAGTPLISDPGYRLVVEARAAGFAVIPIPGASSVMAALCAAGLPTDCFTFAGFLPSKASARHERIAQLMSLPSTLVLFESASRLVATLEVLALKFQAREITIARELTKLHEDWQQGTPSALAAHFTQHPAKGEVVMVIAPPPPTHWQAEQTDALLSAALRYLGVKDAAALVAEQTGLGRSALYQRALALKVI